ncbi:hypothetical protein BO78DRAFT_240793 [Aspergillus sclerotiicarbonarius CBS 121057]|uniref:Uncharacterized protein n=1 Tax=Aspergillus sclerotiicarbonarius (strain CBS 121057 / IBT 28362) TaxID=1448318 RepID=A0A319DVM3_ASPSB|nr:hypothetical protein BO78DRAFT_240793 [Aspergillus sclerotiicarbonarius CBS 121057]
MLSPSPACKTISEILQRFYYSWVSGYPGSCYLFCIPYPCTLLSPRFVTAKCHNQGLAWLQKCGIDHLTFKISKQPAIDSGCQHNSIILNSISRPYSVCCLPQGGLWRVGSETKNFKAILKRPTSHLSYFLHAPVRRVSLPDTKTPKCPQTLHRGFFFSISLQLDWCVDGRQL